MIEISVTCPNCQLKKIKTDDGFRFDFEENNKWINRHFRAHLNFPKCSICYEGKELKFEIPD